MNCRSVPVLTVTVRGKKSLKVHNGRPGACRRTCSAVTVAVGVTAPTGAAGGRELPEHDSGGAGRRHARRSGTDHEIHLPSPSQGPLAPGAFREATLVQQHRRRRCTQIWDERRRCPPTTDAPSATGGAALTAGADMHAITMNGLRPTGMTTVAGGKGAPELASRGRAGSGDGLGAPQPSPALMLAVRFFAAAPLRRAAGARGAPSKISLPARSSRDRGA